MNPRALATAPVPDRMLHIVYIDIGHIAPNPFQPRQHMPEAELEELVVSIKDHGVLQPLWIRSYPGRSGHYLLIAGQRRQLAAERAGFTEVPAIIYNVGDIEAAFLSWIENGQREQLTPLEDLAHMESVMLAAEKAGETMGPAGLARRMGKNIGWVENRLALRELQPDLREFLQRNPGKMSHALVMRTISNASLRDAVRHFADRGAALTPLTHMVRAATVARVGPDTIQQMGAQLERERYSKVAVADFAAIVEALINARVQEDKANQAPDGETGRRSARNAQTGGGGVSRGRELTGPEAKEVREQVDAAMVEAERYLRNALSWRKSHPATPANFAGRMLTLRSLLDEIETAAGP